MTWAEADGLIASHAALGTATTLDLATRIHLLGFTDAASQGVAGAARFTLAVKAGRRVDAGGSEATGVGEALVDFCTEEGPEDEMCAIMESKHPLHHTRRP